MMEDGKKMISRKAYEISTKNEIWLTDDMIIHREDGPAYINSMGSKMWVWHGDLHREDGPASIYPDGSVSYWYKGNCYPFDEWCELTNRTEDEALLLKLQYNSRIFEK